MKKTLLCFLFLVSCASVARAQVTANNHLIWDESDTDQPTVSAYTYKYYLDSSSTGTPFPAASVSCVAGGVPGTFTCSVLISTITALASGSHTITFTATNAAGESGKSVVLTFTLVTVPAVPANPRTGP